jgi:indole-3-glycerol phosphate synthase
MTALDEILATKRDEITMLHRPEVRDLLQREALEGPAPRDFLGALRAGGAQLGVIAEIKRRSPSKGPLAPDLDAAVIAKSYESGGAACLSVLTDAVYFGGTVEDLRVARASVGIPVLRKDFVLDEVQVYETRAVGADAMLLIAAAVTDDVLFADLHALALELELAVLVEAHDEREVERALGVGAQIVGVNARDLDTFSEDLSVGERVVARFPAGVLAVAESAIRSEEDAARMAAMGFDAVLVGEMLVRSADPRATVRALASLPRQVR